MAVRFLIAFLLFVCGASAQVFQTNNVPYKFRGLKADSMLVVPSGADTANLANPKWGENMNGALFAKTGDSTLWMKVGTRWVKVSSTATAIDTTSLSNRINLKVDSITSSNDSLYYYVNGTQYYVSSFTGFDTAVVVKAQVHNAESTTLLAGEVVYGFSSTGNLLSVKRANNKLESTSSKTFGIVRKDIPAGGIGWIVTNGVVDKLNLGAYTAGQEVYLDSINGQFTATKPLAPYNMVFVGIVERANAGNGQLYVKIQNGFELYELHNVSARFPSNNQVLKFRALDSLWTPQTDTGITSLTAGVGLTGGTITTSGTIAADTNVLSTRAWRQKGLDSLALLELSLADTAAMLTPYARGTGANGQIAYWNGTRSLTGSNNLFYNATNRRLGIGTASPSGYLNIAHTAADSNTSSIVTSGYNLTGSNAQSAVDISGTWNTTGTPTLIRANVTNTASNANSLLMDLQVGGVQRLRTDINGTLFLGSNNFASIGRTADGSNNIFNGFGLRFTNNVGSQSQFGFYFRSINSNLSAIAGSQGTININEGFTPSSGTATFTNILVNPTINQTGGANGITRGLYVNPTLTAAADWRSIEWSNNTGFGLYGAGTASNALAGPTTIGAAASPSASAVLDLTSTTRGLLPPRMTAAQRTGIANAAGLLVWDSDSARYMVNNGSAWRGLAYTQDANGVNALSAIGSTPNANGATITGTTLNLQPASASFGGVVTTGDQSFAGKKLFQQIDFGNNKNTPLIYFRNLSSANVGFVLDNNYYPVMFTQQTGINAQWAWRINTVDGVTGGSNLMVLNALNGLTVSAPITATNFSAGNTVDAATAYARDAGAGNRSGWGTNTAADFQFFHRSAFKFTWTGGGDFQSTSTNQWMQLSSTNLAIGTTAPSASAKLDVVSTTQGFLMPRMTSTQRDAISLPTTGLQVFNSTNNTIDVRDGTRWNNTPNGLKNSATLDFGSTAAQTSADLTITVTGAAEGDMVFLGTPNGAVNANTNFTAWVSATNTVTIRFNNYSSGSVDPASGTFRVYVIKN